MKKLEKILDVARRNNTKIAGVGGLSLLAGITTRFVAKSVNKKAEECSRRIGLKSNTKEEMEEAIISYKKYKKKGSNIKKASMFFNGVAGLAGITSLGLLTVDIIDSGINKETLHNLFGKQVSHDRVLSPEEKRELIDEIKEDFKKSLMESIDISFKEGECTKKELKAARKEIETITPMLISFLGVEADDDFLLEYAKALKEEVEGDE